MIERGLSEVADLAGATLSGAGAPPVTGKVTPETRALAPGERFVAVAGERVAGHDFLGLRTLGSSGSGKTSTKDLLGPDAAGEHDRPGRDAAAAGVDLLVAVGPDAVGIAEGAAAAGRRAGEESVHVPDRAAARELLARTLRAGDVVLVRASHSCGLDVLAADALTAEACA